MSIRSLIAIENNDNTIESIYCHWGGAPENNGRILHEHFNSREKLKELIALGNISELHPRLYPVGSHSYDKKEKGTTVTHHRDKGETWDESRPQKFATLKKFFKGFGYWYVEYIYVLSKKGQWTLYLKEESVPFQTKYDLATFLEKRK